MHWLLVFIIFGVGGANCKAYFKKNRHPNALKAAGYPVLLVPGDGGSQIEANLTGKPSVVHYACSKTTNNYFDLWLNLEQFLPIAIDCWVDNMRLVYNASTGKTENMPGVETRIPGNGSTESIEWLDKSKAGSGRYFTDIAEMLVSWGYRRGKSVMGAPFDWRKAPNEFDDYYTNLRSTIETMYKYNGNTKVVIIGHSMGNPVMLYFYHNYVTQDWKDKFIKSHISLAGAWGGSMQIVRLFASGYNMNHYRLLLPPNKLRQMQRSLTSSSFLFPSYNVWNTSEMIGQTKTKNYTLQNVKEFFTDINYPDGWSQYENTAHLLRDLAAPNVEMHCLYGYGIDTPESFFWPNGYFPDYQPVTSYGDGDGSVNRRSLEHCGTWTNRNGGKNVTMMAIKNEDHMGILANAYAIEHIRKVIYGVAYN